MLHDAATLKLSVDASILVSGSIPSKPAIREAAKSLLESTKSWKAGKSFYKNVKTCSKPKDKNDGGVAWHCRVSEHPDTELDFDTLWHVLSVNRAEREREMTPEVESVTKIMDVSPTQQVWSMLYKYPKPISNRVFTVLQDISLDEEDGCRSGTIVSVPVDLDHTHAQKEEKGVKGRRVSVEEVREMGNGRIEWRLATSSFLGGQIPRIFVDMALPGIIAKDVPHMRSYIEKKKKQKSG